MSDLTVVCVLKRSPTYDVDYVEHLMEGVAKHGLGHARFLCLSDCDVPCERAPLLHGWRGWFSKIELFRVCTGKTLYFDLDTVIHGDISMMEDAIKGFTMVHEGRECTGNSSIMGWDGDYSYLYTKFLRDADALIDWHAPKEKVYPRWRHSDQAYIHNTLCQQGVPVLFWQRVLPGLFTFFRNTKRTIREQHPITAYYSKPRPRDTGWSL